MKCSTCKLEYEFPTIHRAEECRSVLFDFLTVERTRSARLVEQLTAEHAKREAEAKAWEQERNLSDTLAGELTAEHSKREAAERHLREATRTWFENQTETLVNLRQECARVAHEKSGSVRVGYEVGLIDLLPYMTALSQTAPEEKKT